MVFTVATKGIDFCIKLLKSQGGLTMTHMVCRICAGMEHWNRFDTKVNVSHS